MATGPERTVNILLSGRLRASAIKESGVAGRAVGEVVETQQDINTDETTTDASTGSEDISD